MKKNYSLLAFSVLAFSTAFGQRQDMQQQLHVADDFKVKPQNIEVVQEKVTYWSEDFANGFTGNNGSVDPTWTVGGADGAIWKHSLYGSSGCYSAGLPSIETTTSSNGFMLFDVDSTNCADYGVDPGTGQPNPGWLAYTGELISPEIDLTAVGGAILEIEQDFRYCCAGASGISLSIWTASSGVWGAPIDLTDGNTTNIVYSTFNSGYSHQLNITSQAANETIRLKFTWDAGPGNLAYFWAIDDIKIIDWPVDDIQLLSAWVSGVNNEGFEYGSTPYNMQDNDYYIGSAVYNWGSATQTNLSLDAVFNGFSSNSTHPSLMNDSTVYMESAETVGPLAVGPYTGDYVVVSDAETGGLNFGNNSGQREFAIAESMTWGTCGSRYSLDGIGVYSSNTLSSLGTNSFNGGEDGLILGTMYHIKEEMPVDGVEIVLTTTSVADGQVKAMIVDTADFWASDFTNPLYESDYYFLTASDISNQVYNIPLLNSGATLSPGAYYACVELQSNAGASHMRILDDLTVAQPSFASAIYLPGGTAPGSYTNGTALAIRLAYDCLSTTENTLDGIEIYPNPSEGLINITNANGYENTIVVYDLAGQEITSMESSSDAVVDLSNAESGIYVVKVSSAGGTFVERVVLK